MQAVDEKIGDLQALRTRIDAIDTQIMELLVQRWELCKLLGLEKERHGQGVYDPIRELEVHKNMLGSINNRIPERLINPLISEVISLCRAAQQTLKVAFLGPEGSFSHEALKACLGSELSELPCSDVKEVFEITNSNEADLGIIPLENSLEGPVNPSYDLLLHFDLVILREYFHKIQLALLAPLGKDPIKILYAQPIALAQCSEWIRKNLKDYQIVEVESTSRGVLMALETGGLAIGSDSLVRYYPVEIIKRHITNFPNNSTRFVVIGRGSNKPTGRDKTSVAFTLQHRPGALYRALEALKDGINICCIFSRPIQGRPWEYNFFLDIEGHLYDPWVKDALERMCGYTTWFKILGSYPQGNAT